MHYFTKKRPFAAGISSVGLSVGSVIWAPIHRRLIQLLGWRGGIFLFSALMLNTLIFAFLLRPIDVVPSQPGAAASSEQLDRKMSTSLNDVTRCVGLRRVYHFMDGVIGISLLTDWRFLFYAFYRSATMTGWFAFLFYCIRRAIYLGMDPLKASLLFSMFGGASAIGRIVGGAIGNAKCTNRQLLCTVCSVIAGGLMMSSGLIPDTFKHNAPYHALLGLFVGK